MVLLLINGCRNAGEPDVSGIKVELTTKRFENDFFSLDTTRLLPALNELGKKLVGLNKY